MWPRDTETCPNGIDIYFDNVGGRDFLMACLDNLHEATRSAMRSISEYGRREAVCLTN